MLIKGMFPISAEFLYLYIQRKALKSFICGSCSGLRMWPPEAIGQSCSSGLTPGLGISICRGYVPKRKKITNLRFLWLAVIFFFIFDTTFGIYKFPDQTQAAAATYTTAGTTPDSFIHCAWLVGDRTRTSTAIRAHAVRFWFLFAF